MDGRVKLLDAQLAVKALVAAGDAAEFRNGREMAAWLGLVAHRSTGVRPTLLGISKRADRLPFC